MQNGDEIVTLTRQELSELLISAAAVGFGRADAIDGGWPIQTRGDLAKLLRRYPNAKPYVLDPEG